MVSLLGVLISLFVVSHWPAKREPEPFVNHIVIDGTINPAVAEFFRESIQQSHEGGARALVIQLDTPGGLLSSTREIVKDILGGSGAGVG
jgi:membrane-bound serine protease (ClpP class)